MCLTQSKTAKIKPKQQLPEFDKLSMGAAPQKCGLKQHVKVQREHNRLLKMLINIRPIFSKHKGTFSPDKIGQKKRDSNTHSEKRKGRGVHTKNYIPAKRIISR